MNDRPICPCEEFIHPAVISNPPGRDNISYRVGDYSTFRRALLLPRLNEKELTYKLPTGKIIDNWRPNGQGDLAVQMIEWWAYLADILTFYSDRIANETYLRTADLPESIQRLIRVLGYRPRPGIGARGLLAALTNTSTSFILPQGWQIQSKPGIGKQPQIFELDTDTLVKTPDVIPVEPVPNSSLIVNGGVLLKGTVTSVKPGDELLFLEKGWDGSNTNYALVTVQKIQPEKDPQGKANTRIIFTNLPSVLLNAKSSNYRLLKSPQSAHVWSYAPKVGIVITSNQVHLEAISRQIQVGNPILLTFFSEQIPTVQSAFGASQNSQALPPIISSQLVSVTQYTEVIWYANGDPNNPQNPPPGRPPNSTEPLIPIPHTQLTFTPNLAGNWDNVESLRKIVRSISLSVLQNVLVSYAWEDVGELIATPAHTFNTKNPGLTINTPISFPPGITQLPILLEDIEGKGISALISQNSQLSQLPTSPVELKPPLQLLLNLLTVSRGETVNNEILGNGDASQIGQEFVLQKSPLTYLLSDDSTSGENYKSTLRIWVNDIKWQEVPSFYGQPANAHIFVTREDENQKTHILFGDGINGARLPSGINNIVASYRYGSGKESPDVGTLNVIVKPYPNLKAIRNPVAVSGGADPDPPEQIRRYAPRSILTFGRAVSGDDYETIAAQTPGVARAKAYWNWDEEEQRTLVLVYVGDDISAVENAKIALKNSADPNRPIQVKQAIALPIQINLSLQIDPIYLTSTVTNNVKSALVNPDTGLLGANTIRIGKSIYQSEIYAACLSVKGVLAVHSFNFYRKNSNRFLLNNRPLQRLDFNRVSMGASDLFLEIPNTHRYDPGEGNFYYLPSENLNITPEVFSVNSEQ